MTETPTSFTGRLARRLTGAVLGPLLVVLAALYGVALGAAGVVRRP